VSGPLKLQALCRRFGQLTDLDAGTVRRNGKSVSPSERLRVGYMPEERGLHPGMLVGEQLEYRRRLHGMSVTYAQAATRRWLERLGVADRADSKVDTLSPGNQQRACNWTPRWCTVLNC
jgi:ABC-2 type transport system ATP-binding protein